MNTLAELLQQGRTEELQERLNPYIYKINNFYQQANTILQATLGKGLFKEQNGLSVFEKMQNTQLSKDDLKITTQIQEARNTLVQNKATDSLQQLNNLLGQGYAILSSFGEELRGQHIEYMITYVSTDGSQLLSQRVLSLTEFTENTFQLDQFGKIHLSGLNNKGRVIQSFLNQASWSQLFKFQQEKHQTLRRNIAETKKEELLDALRLFKTSQNRSKIQSLISDKFLRHGIYRAISKGTDPHEIIARLDNVINYLYNSGRLIEVGAKLINNKSDFLSENINENYDEDSIAFYKQGDFTLQSGNDLIEYQSKLANATVNLTTIINGMQRLTSYISQLQQLNSNKLTQAEESLGNEAEEKAYQRVTEKIIKMFTVKAKIS